MIHKQKKIVEVVDWLGVALIVSAYLSAVFGWVSATDWRYLTANIIGSSFVGYSSWRKKDTQPVMLNLIWIVVAIAGLFYHRG